jgi:hypothetical protein
MLALYFENSWIKKYFKTFEKYSFNRFSRTEPDHLFKINKGKLKFYVFR